MMQQNKGWPDYLVSEIPVMAPFGQYFNDVIHIHYSYFHTVLRSVQCFFWFLGPIHQTNMGSVQVFPGVNGDADKLCGCTCPKNA